jgi:hypothetical protein
MMMMMSVELLMEREMTGETEELVENLSHMTWFGIEPGTPRWEAGD